MQIKRILLTGDDGYNSVGIRLLIRALRDTYELQVAATKSQQSGVGGKLSLSSGGTWGKTDIDGIPAIWVDGSPADVMECMPSFFSKPFDLVISGVNLGANVTTAVVSSGTYCAAIRGMGLNLAPRSLVMSWDAPPEFWHKQHDAEEDISEYFSYPGDVLQPLIERCLKENMWGVDVLNINLPKKATKNIRFTKILKDLTKYYPHPIEVDEKTNTFAYPREQMEVVEKNMRYDAMAVEAGHISITPCAFEMTHFTTFERLEKTTLTL